MSGGYFLEPVQTSGLSATLTAFIKCATVSRQRVQPDKPTTTRGCGLQPTVVNPVYAKTGNTWKCEYEHVNRCSHDQTTGLFT